MTPAVPQDREPAALSDPGTPKPRLLFLQWDHLPNATASRFLLQHMQLHVRALATHFDVTVVNNDCDYDEVCDLHQPDMVLFEAGYRSHGSRRIKITGTGAHPKIPKLGLHNGDPWCDRRAGFIADMDRWGVGAYCSVATQMGVYTPAIADNLFIWPNFIDTETFRDHGLSKVIPVMMTGQSYGLYPWRKAVFDRIGANYPTLFTPSFAYESADASRALTGMDYARALNASYVAPSCGTMGYEVVRKHFEIPGAGCLLMTERSAALQAAGFIDGVNCIFVDENDVLDRLDALFADRPRLAQITAAGQALVHDRHTLAHRPQIRQWYELQSRRAPGERIVQETPFSDLALAPDTSRHLVSAAADHGLDRQHLMLAAAALSQGRVEQARSHYRTCLGYVTYLPEARFGLALCDLAQGRAEEALAWAAGLIESSIEGYGAEDPDPLDWALYLVALICNGQSAQAVAIRDRYPNVAHPQLQVVLSMLGAEAKVTRPPRPSLQTLPVSGAEATRKWVLAMIERCEQPAPGGALPLSSTSAPAGALLRFDQLLTHPALDRFRPAVPPGPGVGYGAALVRRAGRLALRGPLGRPLGWVLARYRRRRAQRRAATAPRKARPGI